MRRTPGLVIAAVLALSFSAVAMAQPAPGGGGPPGGGQGGGKGHSSSSNDKQPEFSGSVCLRMQLDKEGAFPDGLKAKLEKVTGVSNVEVTPEQCFVRCSYAGTLAGIVSVASAASTGSAHAVVVDPCKFDVNFNPESGGTMKSKEVEDALVANGARVAKSLGSGDYVVYFDASTGPFAALDKVAKAFKCKLKVKSHEQLDVKFAGLDKLDTQALAQFIKALLNVKGVVSHEIGGEGLVHVVVEKGRVRPAAFTPVADKFGLKIDEGKDDAKKDDPKK